jgi:hypothetical protein
MDVMDLENIDADAPIFDPQAFLRSPSLSSIPKPFFDPQAFDLSDEEAELNALARRIGRSRLALRAAEYDRDARFPTENYRDMREAGLLGVCVPKDHGGLGAGFRSYSTTAAEIGRYCGATALTWNMHVCTCLWTGALADDLDMAGDDRREHLRRRALHYRRVIAEGADILHRATSHSIEIREDITAPADCLKSCRRQG